MIAFLIQFLIAILVLGVIFYIVQLIASHFGMPAVFIQIIGLILALILILWLLNLAGALPPHLFR